MVNTLKSKVLDYIKMLGLLKSPIKDPNIDFGFTFLYPNKNGNNFIILKPKKKNILEIQSRTIISEEHRKNIELKKKKELFNHLSNVFMSRNLHHMLDLKKNRFMLVSKFYYGEEDEIKINRVSNILKNLFFTQTIAIRMINTFSDSNNPHNTITNKSYFQFYS